MKFTPPFFYLDKLTYHDKQHTGVYRCKAHIVDNYGHVLCGKEFGILWETHDELPEFAMKVEETVGCKRCKKKWYLLREERKQIAS